MLGVQAFPSLIFFILIFFVPESPRWLLLHRGKKEEATAIMLHRENEQELIEHNKNAVRVRYSAEVLKAVFGPVWEKLRQS